MLVGSCVLTSSLVGVSCLDARKDANEVEECATLAVAGEDQSVVLNSTVNLDASGSSMTGDCPETAEIVYSWRFDAVPVDSTVDESSLTYNNTAAAVNSVFLPDQVGDYVLSVETCVDSVCASPDPVVIQVYSSDAAPIADAGPDVTASAEERVLLDGSQSYDPENVSLEYSWALVTVPGCSALNTDGIFEPTTVTPTVVPDCEGVYVVALVVSDSLQWSEPDYATIQVDAGDEAPVADAGESGEVPTCSGDVIELTGFGSYDPDGAPLEYQWSLISAPLDSTASDADFSDVTAAAPSFQWDVEGEYSFQLQVYDGDYWSAPDVVTFLVHGANANHPPVAIITGDLTIEQTAQCTTSNYVWTCDSCSSADFDLDGSTSYDQDEDALNYYWEVFDEGLETDSIPQSAFLTYSAPSRLAEYGVIDSETWDVRLTVSDCEISSTNDVSLTLTCTGTNN